MTDACHAASLSEIHCSLTGGSCLFEHMVCVAWFGFLSLKLKQFLLCYLQENKGTGQEVLCSCSLLKIIMSVTRSHSQGKKLFCKLQRRFKLNALIASTKDYGSKSMKHRLEIISRRKIKKIKEEFSLRKKRE